MLSIKSRRFSSHSSISLKHDLVRETKKLSQMSRVVPSDPDMNLRTQQLLEQFFEAHYLPNEAEKRLLRKAGKVSEEILETWCKFTVIIIVNKH